MYKTSYAPDDNSEQLTTRSKNDMMNAHGELSEWIKELVLKTSDSERNLGFESLTLRQKGNPPNGVDFLFLLELGIRKDGTSAHTGAKKCPVDTSLVRGRIHILMNAPSMGVDMRILFVVVGYRNSIYSVQQTQKGIPTQRVGIPFYSS